MMKTNGVITFILGLLLAVFGAIAMLRSLHPATLIPLLIGLSLCYLGWKGGRTATIVFGHTAIVAGCYLITYGLYLLPYAKPDLAHIFGFPLFWGLFSLFGGICAIYHGFCNCVSCRARK
jgi:hypothetical protein